jgi:nucleoside-diphosphate-sugar epimerase
VEPPPATLRAHRRAVTEGSHASCPSCQQDHRHPVSALNHGKPDIYNIVDDDPVTFAEVPPALADLFGAKPPLHIPTWLARPLAGQAAIDVLTRQRGATNDKAKTELGWQPRRPTWRQGFAAEYRSRR